MKHDERGLSQILLIALVLLIGLTVGIAYKNVQNKNDDTSAVNSGVQLDNSTEAKADKKNSATEPHEGYTKYTSTDHGLEFYHPNEWSITDSSRSIQVASPDFALDINEGGGCNIKTAKGIAFDVIITDILKLDNSATKDYYKNIVQSTIDKTIPTVHDKDLEVVETVVFGEKAASTYTTPGECGWRYTTNTGIIKDMQFEISTSYGTLEDHAYNEYTVEYAKLLETLKLTE